jgi:hypothetical protein
MTKGFHGFPQSLLTNDWIVPSLRHDLFLLKPFQFTVLHISDTIVLITKASLNNMQGKIKKKSFID